MACKNSCAAPPIPQACLPTPEPLDCEQLLCCNHCLLPAFLARNPSWTCSEENKRAACFALMDAEAVPAIAGIQNGQKRARTIMLAALHFLYLRAHSDLTLRANFNNYAVGSAIKMPEFPGRTWEGSPYGLLVKEAIEGEAVLSFVYA